MGKSKMITKLKKNEIFVFGSNAEGNHAGGAAKLAKEKFGAGQGVANGAESKVSGVIGSYIVGSEYKDGVLIDVQVAKVDGKKIKENTWYQLKKGKFVIAD